MKILMLNDIFVIVHHLCKWRAYSACHTYVSLDIQSGVAIYTHFSFLGEAPAKCILSSADHQGSERWDWAENP